VAVPVTGHRQRVDRVELVARCSQGLDPQTPIGLYPHHDLAGLVSQPGDQLVEPADPREPLGEPAARQPVTGLIHDMDIVVILRPVIATKIIVDLPPRFGVDPEPKGSPAAT
jgi:hypothetical protein